jgi:glutamyl-tRNA reductase
MTYSSGALEVALARAGCGRAEGLRAISELVILSTCNRLELYAVVPGSTGGEGAWAVLRGFLAETLALEYGEFESHLVLHRDGEVARHLCRVAAGLESMVLGESEILGQVADAHKAALSQRSAGPVLSALFRAAIRAGKRARAETAIGRNPASVGSVAVEFAAQATGNLAGQSVAVLGAGRMARKAVTVLRARGVGEILVVNRTLAAAAELAVEWGGEAFSFERLPGVLARADIVISSTGAPHTIIGAPVVRQAMVDRQRPLVFIDIAVPRDVDAAVREIPAVHVFDLDDFRGRLDRTSLERQKEVPRVEEIVAEEMERFAEWQAGSEVLPVLSELWRQAEILRSEELARLLRELPGLDPMLHRRLDQFSSTLVNKLLHQPSERLRAEAGNGHAVEYAQVARALFGLEGARSAEPEGEGQ